MTKEQVKELNSVYREVWDLYQDENRFKDFKAFEEKETALWERVMTLNKVVGTGLVPGKLLQWGVADGMASYLVVKVGKRSTEVAHLPFGDAYQFAGVYESKGKLVVPTSIARQAVGMGDFWGGIKDESEDFYQKKLRVGQVVHYSNGFNTFVRCHVTLEKDLLPIELVGEWREYDLPHRFANGEICLGYHAENIKKGKTFKPHASNIFEHKTGERKGIDPRHLKAISLVVPPMTKEEEVKAAKYGKIDRIRKAVNEMQGDDPVAVLEAVWDIVNNP